MSIAYCECVYVALGIQHAMHIVIFSSVGYPIVLYFSALSQTARLKNCY
jgi:hypothetical protein